MKPLIIHPDDEPFDFCQWIRILERPFIDLTEDEQFDLTDSEGRVLLPVGLSQ